ncbi:MAG: hypothetical protein MN733_05880, partial [Nitrososphaera sp.]|nr:hypothetical protein [Nitrososphaera sp.]
IGDPKPMPTAAQARHDLGQLVITLTGVNYQALRPEDIPELQASENFQRFRELIRDSARGIERDQDRENYEHEVKREAEKIVEAWHETKSGLSKGLRNALFVSSMSMAGEALQSVVDGPGVTSLFIQGGIAIMLLAHERRLLAGPYQYLTEIKKAENEFLRMTFPLGLEP